MMRLPEENTLESSCRQYPLRRVNTGNSELGVHRLLQIRSRLRHVALVVQCHAQTPPQVEGVTLQYQNNTVTAIELGPTRAVAREMTGIDPKPVLFEDFDAPQESFSAILMSQVLEHVHDVNLWTRRAFELLRPGGVLAIALPHFGSGLRGVLGERDPFISPPEHLNFFTGESLRLLLLRHGLQPGRTEYRSRIPPRAGAGWVNGYSAAAMPMANPTYCAWRQLMVARSVRFAPMADNSGKLQ